MNAQTVLVEIDAGIATLTLNRPEVKNALNGDMRVEMREAVHRIRRIARCAQSCCAAQAATSARAATCAG